MVYTIIVHMYAKEVNEQDGRVFSELHPKLILLRHLFTGLRGKTESQAHRSCECIPKGQGDT